jgi:hypothetical protein
MRLTISVAAVLFAGSVQYSFASTITNGFFDISGTVFFTSPRTVAVVTPAGTCPANTACILWENTTGSVTDKVDISTASLPNGDIPLALAGTDAADIDNLTNPPDVVGGAGFAPATFMTFNNAGITTQLLVDFIEPGIFSSSACGAAPAVGQVCTVPGSPVNFINLPPKPGQANASWVLEGVTDTPGISWTGNFGSQFTTPYQSVLANLASKGYVSNTFSATISLTGTPTTIPEPGSMGLTMIGMGLIATFVGRRSAK